jgi:tetratricopeptide (TPR) repeat protein
MLRLLSRGRKEEAEERARKFRDLGWAHYLEEDYELAQQNLSQACDYHSGSNFASESNLVLGHVHFYFEHYNHAAQCYKRAIKHATDSRLHSVLRLLRLSPGRIPGFHHNLAWYHCFLGDADRKQGRFDEAFEEFEKARLEYDKGEKRNRTLINDHRATFLDDQKHIFLSQLATAYIELYSAHPNATVKKKADILEGAKKASEEAACLKPNDGDLLNDLGVVYYYQGENAASATENSEAISFLYKAKTRFERATKAKSKTVFDLDLAVTHARLGDLQTETEQYGEAINHYLEAIDLARKAGGDEADYHNRLGLAYDRSGQMERAISEYEAATAQQKDEDGPVWLANLGNACLRTERYDDAIRSYVKALGRAKVGVEAAGYHNQLGVAYDEKNEIDKAIEQYKEAISRQGDQKNAVYYSNLGYAYYRQNQYVEAAAELEEAVQLDKDNAKYWNSLGNAYYGGAQYAEAVPSYLHAVELKPKHAIYHRNLGKAYLDDGKLLDAINAFSRQPSSNLKIGTVISC